MTLRGVAWDHTRAMAPLHGLAQVWRDRTGDEPVRWDLRSLKSFAEDPLDLFGDYDLIVFDYPFAGEALAAGWVHDLTSLLSEDVLQARAASCVGRAHQSFTWNGQQAALAIDVATQVAAWRPDLLATPPNDWDETLELARSTGTVAMPMTPTAIWGALISMCANAGATPLAPGGMAFDRMMAQRGLSQLAALAALSPDFVFISSPVAILNRMITTDTIAYCPITYGYSTYGMRGYGAKPLKFSNMRLGGADARGAILGGAGIGVLAGCKVPERAAAYAAWLTSDNVQATLYAQFGGQPAAGAAWDDPCNDALTNGFYAGTRASIDACFHRPNLPGFHAFQTRSATALHRVVKSDADPEPVLASIEEEWRALAPGEGRV